MTVIAPESRPSLNGDNGSLLGGLQRADGHRRVSPPWEVARSVPR